MPEDKEAAAECMAEMLCISRVQAVSSKGLGRRLNNNFLHAATKPQNREAAASWKDGKKYTFTRVVPNADQLKIVARYVEEMSFNPLPAACLCMEECRNSDTFTEDSPKSPEGLPPCVKSAWGGMPCIVASDMSERECAEAGEMAGIEYL